MDGILTTCTYWKQLFVCLTSSLLFLTTSGQNPIAIENALAGSPQSEWDISGSGDLTIQGFATDISVNKGNRIHFKIDTDADQYTITIYRLGYYGGLGARNWGSGVISAALPQNQPDPIEDPVTGIVDCGNWAESAYWDVPANAVSGLYIALLQRADNNGKSHIPFIVRDDASTADLFFQTSDATWQAYNGYGGNSLYVGSTSFPSGHATKVSYNRPFLTRSGGGGGGPEEDWIFNAEYPMIRFLERNGYDIAYTTNLDMARDGSRVLQHKVFLSVGHDEYWSAEQRTAVENARAAGVHLAFFSGNEVYWKTRWENSVDGNNTPYRTLVCYKEGDMGEVICGTKCDPSPVWTGLWRTPMGEPYGGNKPENALTGQISWDLSTGAIEVPSQYKNLRFWRNTSVATMGGEEVRSFTEGTLGFEWNFEQPEYAAFNPPGRILMSSTSLNGKVHKLSMYRDQASGALVFGAGTVQWAWGLDEVHDRGNAPANQDMQQATVNLLADMGVQATTLMPGLVAATESTDNQAPISIITTPAQGANVSVNSQVLIQGTTSDNAVVAGVEISFDDGATWTAIPNAGNNWQYTWTPVQIGSTVIKVRGFDDSGNIESENPAPAANAISITVDVPNTENCPCTIFNESLAPDITNIKDGSTGIEFGTRFKPVLDGYVSAIRFFKSSNANEPHTGSLWTNDGTLLASVLFTNETASGWQEATLSAPVAVSADVSYVVSVYSESGFYAKSESFFNSNYGNGPLVATATSDPSGPNGMFKYTNSPVFPDQSFNASNYFVDVVFDSEIGPDETSPLISGSNPQLDGINFPVTGSPYAVFNEALDPLTVTASTIELRDAGNNPVAGVVSYDNGSKRAIFTPDANLSYSSQYTLVVSGGVAGVKDLAGNALSNDTLINFSTQDPPPGNPGDGPGGPILVIHTASNPFSRFTAEILRAEGLNHFAVLDISAVDETVLQQYDVVILGEVPVSAAQATLFSNWTNAGGTFIAFKPDADLESLLGITAAGGSLANQYLLIDNSKPEGVGLVNETIQFHGDANLYTVNGATTLATLYSNASTATANPAVTINTVGSNGGRAIAFAYDLPKSIVYTRQGNPAWSGQKRDGTNGPIRSNDMYTGTNGDADWIDFDKVAIPQADEQQRLLTNIIIRNNLAKKPLPRFWFLPQGFKAAVVMTGDDHASEGTTGRFELFKTMGPNGVQDVKDWKAIRGTSYIYPNTPISNTDAVELEQQGFELALHPTTNCVDWTENSLNTAFVNQLADFSGNFPGLSAPATNRTHCMAWSDWATKAKVSVQNGIRLDVNYYYWPGSWINDRPGMFTGSGMPMRFADIDGSLIDVYQVATQLVDESEINYSAHITSLLDNAIGQKGYYGVFCANMHTDSAQHIGATTIINAAKARNIPVISAKQMLNWLDGRNGSSFSNLAWNNNELSFSINALLNAYKMQAILPLLSSDGTLSSITRDGQSVSYTVETIKGIQYAFFDAASGDYVAIYAPGQFANISGSVTLQGRAPAPNAQWEVPLTVDIYAEGNNTTPAFSYNVVTDQNGNFNVSNIQAGTYTIAVKNAHTLKRVLVDQIIVAGNNSLNFGTLLEGDANNDNVVDLLDYGGLLLSYNQIAGNPAYLVGADLNEDGVVDLLDLGLMLINYNQTGENP